MNKKVGKLKLFTLILVLVQLVIVGVFTALYITNAGDIADNIPFIYLPLGFTVLLLIDCVYMLFVFLNLKKIRKQSDIRIEQLLGVDISEAYLTAKTGLVVVDKNGVVLWQSDYLYQTGIDIVEQNIFKWHKKFEDFLKEGSDYKVTVKLGKQTFSVKYLKNAGIFIFVEISELAELNEYVKDQSPVIGIITIDNYMELIGNSEQVNNVVNVLKNKIYGYAKRFNVLLRTLRNDSFFVICNYATFRGLLQDQFSILGEAKKCVAPGGVKPTLTIGFSYGYPDINKLNEMSANAVEIGMTRGGDQAVVAKYGSDFAFYGGKTETHAKHNTVQIRSVGDAVMNLIEKSENVYIMGHLDMDLDALGSALGVYEICASIKKPAAVIYDPKLTERKTRGALASHFTKAEISNIFISPQDALTNIKGTTLVIVVDVNRQKSTMCPEILEKTNKVIVLDHHRRAADNIIESTLLSYVDPGASSASEIVTEIIKYSPTMSEVKVRPLIATFMMAGVFLDTGFFKNKTVGNRAFEACVVLKSFGADNVLADDMLKDEFEEYVFVNKIMNTLKTPYYGVVYCIVEEDEIVERSVLAKVATQCVNLKGIQAAFAIGKVESGVVGISARTDGTVNAQVLCEKMGGGGHFSSAATTLTDLTIKEAEKLLLETLQLYLNEARSDVKPKGK